MYKTVYLNAYTEGKTTDGLNNVNFNTDNTGYDLKTAPTGIIINFIVCGNEQL